mmetsp:Transcript_17022/g.30364  ORF Transcript_17022/g.30364 Transcript_17022/m.30364 type:complete len:378 (-) Transcript_17022:684-1817(-)
MGHPHPGDPVRQRHQGLPRPAHPRGGPRHRRAGPGGPQEGAGLRGPGGAPEHLRRDQGGGGGDRLGDSGGRARRRRGAAAPVRAVRGVGPQAGGHVPRGHGAGHPRPAHRRRDDAPDDRQADPGGLAGSGGQRADEVAGGLGPGQAGGGGGAGAEVLRADDGVPDERCGQRAHGRRAGGDWLRGDPVQGGCAAPGDQHVHHPGPCRAEGVFGHRTPCSPQAEWGGRGDRRCRLRSAAGGRQTAAAGPGGGPCHGTPVRQPAGRPPGGGRGRGPGGGDRPNTDLGGHFQAPPGQHRLCLGQHHLWLQRALHLLRGPRGARGGAVPPTRVHPEGDRGPRGPGLPRDHAPGAEHRRLRSRHEPAADIRRPPALCPRRAGH